MLILHFFLSSAVMSIVVLMLAVIWEVFPNAVGVRHRYAAWVVVLIGFIVPLRPVVGGGLVNLTILPNLRAVMAEDVTVLTQMDLVGEAASALFVSPYFVALLVWLSGALFFLSYYTLKHIKFMRLVKRWGDEVTDKAVLAVLNKVREEKCVGRIRLLRCGFISTSMLVGYFKPCVLLPDKEFDIYELELIFRHELVHLRRKDLFVKLLTMVVAIIHWFNPAVYLMSAQMQSDCEASCDEAVLAETGEQNKLSYAELIIEMIGTKRQYASSLSTCFYGSKRSIKKRMNAIMEPRNGKLRLLAVLPVLVITVLSGSVFVFTEREFVALPIEDAVLEEIPTEGNVMDDVTVDEAGCGLGIYHGPEHGRHNRRGRMWRH